MSTVAPLLLACPTCGAMLPPGSICDRDKTQLPVAKLQPGFFAGEYQALEKLAEGGMGEVWRGQQPAIRKPVAIKVLGEKFIHNADVIARFNREALAVNKIKNKHIVDIFSTGELPDRRPYFVMEFLEGMPLSSYLSESPSLSFVEILHLMGQICKGLQAAHDAGVVHRDLKPDNIFLVLEEGEKPFVKLLDFGIAKLVEGLEEREQLKLTAAGTAFGTPAYMSPEQCKGSEQIDHRSDIYALGVILFELLTGVLPFCEEGAHRLKILMLHVTRPAPAPGRVMPERGIPRAVDLLVERMLAKEPTQRPDSCSMVLRELTEALGGLAARAPLPEMIHAHRSSHPRRPQNQSEKTTRPNITPLPKPITTDKSPRPARALVLGGLVVLFALVLSVIFWRESSTSEVVREQLTQPPATQRAPRQQVSEAPPSTAPQSTTAPAKEELATTAPSLPVSAAKMSPKLSPKQEPPKSVEAAPKPLPKEEDRTETPDWNDPGEKQTERPDW